jgi:hypothetical protein
VATLLNDGFDHHNKLAMALSEFEIAIGGLTSIPVVGGLIFLGYKSLGESSLDTSKLKPKKKTAVTKGKPTPEKKDPEPKSQKIEKNINTTTTSEEKTSVGEHPKPAKEKTSISNKKQPEDKAKVMPPNQTIKPEK